MSTEQLKAGVKKELMLIWRSFRLGGIILAFLGCAAYYPFSVKMSQELFENADPSGSVFGVSMEEIAESVSDPFFSTLSSFSGIAIIIAMVLLSAAAGGEQKKRSIILPQTAGLTPAGYVFPKFLLYPPLIFVITMFSAFAADAVCVLLTKEVREIGAVAAAGAMTGVYMMFFVCFYLFMGISTVQPGLSVIYVYAANELFAPLISVYFRVNKYTPWSLTGMAYTMQDGGGINAAKMGNIAVTVIITLVLCIGLAFAALFAVTAKKTDNTADEVF